MHYMEYRLYIVLEFPSFWNKTFSKNQLNLNTGEYRLDIIKAEIEVSATGGVADLIHTYTN